MNRKQHSVLLASLLAFALAGCSSTKGSADDTPSTAGATASGAGTMPTRSADTGTGGTATGSGSMAAQPQAQPPATTPADTAPMPGAMPGAMPNAIVMSIEPMPRQGAVGASGTAGATGSSMGDDKVYRITLRMDDGTTRVVTQEKAPAYRSGDRVNMMDGVISR